MMNFDSFIIDENGFDGLVFGIIVSFGMVFEINDF